MKIISGSNKLRYSDTINNHSYYSSYHNYTYEFYHLPEHTNPYFIKIEKLIENLKIYKHVMWLDDDAFFCDLDWSAKNIYNLYNFDFVVAKSPPGRNVPLFNSGVIFCKQSDELINFLTETLDIERDYVRKYYNTSKWGKLVDGDQDILIYLSQTKYSKISKIIDPHYQINARVRDYQNEIHPIVHFAGVRDRENAIKRFEHILRK